MGIIAHCYYDEGPISKKFNFILRYILGTRNVFRKPVKSSSAIDSASNGVESEEIQENK
jgi:hypothetical protein